MVNDIHNCVAFVCQSVSSKVRLFTLYTLPLRRQHNPTWGGCNRIKQRGISLDVITWFIVGAMVLVLATWMLKGVVVEGAWTSGNTGINIFYSDSFQMLGYIQKITIIVQCWHSKNMKLYRKEEREVQIMLRLCQYHLLLHGFLLLLLFFRKKQKQKWSNRTEINKQKQSESIELTEHKKQDYSSFQLLMTRFM